MEREQLLRQRVQADFEYNLRLVEERDAELTRYEAAAAELRQAVNLLTAESSELKVMRGVNKSHLEMVTATAKSCTKNFFPAQVCLAEREMELGSEREERRRMIENLQAELEEKRWSQREEAEEERRRCEKVRRELEAKLREVEREGERVRLEMTAQFDEEAFRLQEQHRTQVYSHFSLSECK